MTMDSERERLYREFSQAVDKRKEVFAEYERLNRSWWSVFNPRAHRAFSKMLKALAAQNDTHERLNAYIEKRLRETMMQDEEED